jgi:hypothetical protein
MKKLDREELINLVQKIMDCKVPEQELYRLVHLLKVNVSDPNVTDYIYWFEPALSAENVIDKALAYKPSKDYRTTL